MPSSMNPAQSVAMRASQEEKALNNAQLSVFRIQVESLSFEGEHHLTGRGLRVCFRTRGGACYLYPEATRGKIKDGASVFDFKESFLLPWEGEGLECRVYQSNMLFPATELGKCTVSLLDVYQTLVGEAKSCNTSKVEPSPLVVEVSCKSGSEMVTGQLRLFVSCTKALLGALGGRKALKVLTPAKRPKSVDVHSETLKLCVQQVHEARSLQEQIKKVQADLWLAGVQKLTQDGMLDMSGLHAAGHLGFVPEHRAKLLRKMIEQDGGHALRRGSTSDGLSAGPYPGLQSGHARAAGAGAIDDEPEFPDDIAGYSTDWGVRAASV